MDLQDHNTFTHTNDRESTPPPMPPKHQSFGKSEILRKPVYPGRLSYQRYDSDPFTDSHTALSQRSSEPSPSLHGSVMEEARHSRVEMLRGYPETTRRASSGPDYLVSNNHPEGYSTGEFANSHTSYSPYSDNPYNAYSPQWDRSIEQPINPDEIADDGDEGLGPGSPVRARAASQAGSRFMPNLPITSSNGVATPNTTGTAGQGDLHGTYGPVSSDEQKGFDRYAMLAKEAKAKRRKKLIFIILGILVVAIGVIVGTVAGVLITNKKNQPSAASIDDSTLLTAQSQEIQALMHNTNLHRVFPGMDYTPYNAQYPACTNNPPSQNNVTRDMAVLSQLTKTIRLYGTDCNQTDMVLAAFDLLGLTDMKVWLGVWLDNNTETNDRGKNAMLDILSRKGQSPFEGVIVGNEVLFREDMTEDQLSGHAEDVRSSFKSAGYTLPIAIADLGDKWTAGLAEAVDVVMANVHPFFAGVTPDAATAWTLNFWQTKDVPLTTGTSKKSIIAETGWPSGGGNDCGAATCTNDQEGSVASVDNMNIFMEGWVCSALANGTNYFWFEGIDEPWKVQFNTPTDQWETRWGLFDAGRNLKTGIKIPDCGGQTV